MFRSVSFLTLLCSVSLPLAAELPRRPITFVEREQRDDPPAALVWRMTSSPAAVSQYNGFTSYQVNVDPNGENIMGDAANEPSLTVDPTNGNKMSIGWRQFNSVQSNFRQAGFGYTTDRGLSWTFGGNLSSTFRSDPVLQSEAGGTFFYLSLISGFYDDIWRSDNSGQSWFQLGPATGGDKQWFTIDTTNSPGRGFQYQSWSSSGNNYGGRQFSRSVDRGVTWMDPINIPNSPAWGTLDVASNGTLFIGGVQTSTGWFWCVRSTDAKNGAVIPTFDRSTRVDLGGFLTPATEINPEGLTGQVYVAVDRSGSATNNNVYMLASVRPYDATTGLDVMFARSTDGGQTFSAPRRINDDGPNTGDWHWFGTLAVAPNGRIDVVWYDTRSRLANHISQLYYSYSYDGGESWSRNVAVSEIFNPHFGYPNQSKIGDYISLVSDNDAGHVAYCATLNAEQDIFYVRVTPSTPPFAVRSVTRDGMGAKVSFVSQNGKTYRCDYSDAPGGPWLELQRDIGGTGGQITVTDAGAVEKQERFYRFVMLP